MSVNTVMLVGNLGADVELKYTPNSRPVATIRLATSKRWKSKSGETQEKTQWHRVIVWGARAENCAKYLKKGSKVLIQGELEYRSWEDADKVRHYITEVVAQDVQFLDSRAKNQNTNENDDVPFDDMPSDNDAPDDGNPLPV